MYVCMSNKSVSPMRHYGLWLISFKLERKTPIFPYLLINIYLINIWEITMLCGLVHQISFFYPSCFCNCIIHNYIIIIIETQLEKRIVNLDSTNEATTSAQLDALIKSYSDAIHDAYEEAIS